MAESVEALYAGVYDLLGVGWPGEMEFYRELAATATARGEPVLEVACGTGRVAIPLAEDGARVTGFDLSPEMIAVARRKSQGRDNPRWAVADMRSFGLGETYGLVIIPGHAFQSMLTPEDQLSCLAAIHRHLHPGGALVIHLDHQDVDWLGTLPSAGEGTFEQDSTLVHPDSGHALRSASAWTYDRATQTATVTTRWEELNADGGVRRRCQQGPIPLHCVFRFEMEHLLARAGFRERQVYGDFHRAPLTRSSEEMIWMATGNG